MCVCVRLRVCARLWECHSTFRSISCEKAATSNNPLLCPYVGVCVCLCESMSNLFLLPVWPFFHSNVTMFTVVGFQLWSRHSSLLCFAVTVMGDRDPCEPKAHASHFGSVWCLMTRSWISCSQNFKVPSQNLSLEPHLKFPTCKDSDSSLFHEVIGTRQQRGDVPNMGDSEAPPTYCLNRLFTTNR